MDILAWIIVPVVAVVAVVIAVLIVFFRDFLKAWFGE